MAELMHWILELKELYSRAILPELHVPMVADFFLERVLGYHLWALHSSNYLRASCCLPSAKLKPCDRISAFHHVRTILLGFAAEVYHLSCGSSLQ